MVAAAEDNVLLTSAGSKVSLARSLSPALTRAVPSSQLTIGDSGSQAPAKYIFLSFLQLPILEGLQVESVMSALEENQVFGVVPMRNGELLFWSASEEQLRNRGIELTLSTKRL